MTFAFAPHAPYTISDATFERIGVLMGQTGLPLQIHLHETEAELRQSEADHGDATDRPSRAPRSRRTDVDRRFIRCTSTAREIALFAERCVSIAHCPASNLKLGSGIAPIARYLEAGINVGIGTDGVARNNRLDMPGRDATRSAYSPRGASGRADAGSTRTRCCSAATLAGAKPCGIDDRIGSIVVGKDADLVAFDLSALDFQPVFDVASHLIFVTGREAVTDVWVAGIGCCAKATIRCGCRARRRGQGCKRHSPVAESNEKSIGCTKLCSAICGSRLMPDQCGVQASWKAVQTAYRLETGHCACMTPRCFDGMNALMTAKSASR